MVNTEAALSPATAVWFDGHSSQRQAGQLRLEGPELVLAVGQHQRRFAMSSLKVGEPWPGNPLPIGLPDGGTVWLDEGQPAWRDELLRQAGPQPWAARLSATWPASLACLLAVLLLLFWFDRQGAAVLGDQFVRLVPHSVDEAVGEAAWTAISREWLAPTHVPPDRQQALRTRFQAVADRVAPGVKVDLRFHRVISDTATGAGFNAFALPNGTVVLLDGLCEALDDAGLMAVLGHELGHLVHRDSMRAAARTLGLVTVAQAVFGEFSSVLADGVAAVQTFAYSRDAERAADADARAFVAQAGLPPDTLAKVWRAFDAQSRGRNQTGLPTWLSTHPPTEERLRQAEAR